MVRYKSQMLLSYCEMDISDVIVRYKSQILVSYWEIEISDFILL